LHVDELTYSLTLLRTDPRVEGGVLESYRRLGQGLLTGLRRLGAEAAQSIGQQGTPADPSVICFQNPSPYEIVVRGHKLVGSAQWRAEGGVLQHGTLPLCGDLARIVTYLALDDAEREVQRRRLRARALTLEQALGNPIAFSQAARALADGLAHALNVVLAPGELTAHERSLAAELRHSRYADLAWTAHV
jgi:lipoate-protein ligase A